MHKDQFSLSHVILRPLYKGRLFPLSHVIPHALQIASSVIVTIQPQQISLPQHDSKIVNRESSGNGRKQIGHSSGGGGSLNSSSSCNSATLLSHAFLCFERCFFLHAALQYLTSLHLLHVLRLPPSLPHDAHAVVECW